jgi:hypothetical protein
MNTSRTLRTTDAKHAETCISIIEDKLAEALSCQKYYHLESIKQKAKALFFASNKSEMDDAVAVYKRQLAHLEREREYHLRLELSKALS